MIRYALTCGHAHEFEGWFASSNDYDDQRAKGLLSCPVCESGDVRKQIMAPAVAGTRTQDASRDVAMQALGKLREHIEETYEDVGDAFAAEARAIHEGRSEDRDIYGQATGAEVQELLRDRISVAPLPPAPRSKKKLN